MLQKLIDYDKILCRNAFFSLHGVALNAVTICLSFSVSGEAVEINYHSLCRRRRPQDKLEFMRQLSTKTICFLVAVLNKPRFLLSLTTVVYESVYFEQIFLNVFFFNHLQESRLIADVPLTLFDLSRIARKAAKMPSRRYRQLGKLKKKNPIIVK